eukprot:8284809-Pyramimonas_sp.AAC.1
MELESSPLRGATRERHNRGNQTTQPWHLKGWGETTDGGVGATRSTRRRRPPIHEGGVRRRGSGCQQDARCSRCPSVTRNKSKANLREAKLRLDIVETIAPDFLRNKQTLLAAAPCTLQLAEISA